MLGWLRARNLVWTCFCTKVDGDGWPVLSQFTTVAGGDVIVPCGQEEDCGFDGVGADGFVPERVKSRQ